MKIYGNVTLSEGSDIRNLTVAHGDAYPSEPNLGELFYHTIIGLSFYDGVQWISLTPQNNTPPQEGAVNVQNIDFSVEITNGAISKITPVLGFIAKSTQLYANGLRQKLGIDYFEVDTYLVLNFSVLEEEINNGVNLVLDIAIQNPQPEILNDDFTLEYQDGTISKIIPSQAFIEGSTKLFVSGLRQQLGTDYIEVGSHIELNFSVSSEDIDNGINIVLDFIKQL